MVTAFAILGDVLRPKSFAGLFGAAPSVALFILGPAQAGRHLRLHRRPFHDDRRARPRRLFGGRLPIADAASGLGDYGDRIRPRCLVRPFAWP
jgi:hypothetical protein